MDVLSEFCGAFGQQVDEWMMAFEGTKFLSSAFPP